MKKKMILLTGLLLAIQLSGCGNSSKDASVESKNSSLIETIPMETAEASNMTETTGEITTTGATTETTAILCMKDTYTIVWRNIKGLII